MKRKSYFYPLFGSHYGRIRSCNEVMLNSRCGGERNGMYKMGIVDNGTGKIRDIRYLENKDLLGWVDEPRLEGKSINAHRDEKGSVDRKEAVVKDLSKSKVNSRSEMGFPMDLLLNSIAGQEKGMRFNFTLINSVILKFLDHKKLTSLLPIEPIFRFAKALPLTLVSGYIYLEKYINKIRFTFSDCSRLVKFFLVCCFIGSKFTYDTHCSSESFLTNWNIMAKEVNYIEGLVLSTINYDVEISNSDIKRVALQNGLFFDDRRSLDLRFYEAINWWKR